MADVKQIFAALVVLTAAAALGQEIGTELPPGSAPPPPAPTSPTTYDNPYAPPPAPTAPLEPPKEAVAKVAGPAKGALGIRAAFGSAGLPVAGGGVPTLGLKYFATDKVGITFDLGLGMVFASGNIDFGFASGLGVDAHLGSAEKPLRPFVTGGVLFGKALSRLGDDFSLGMDVGGGAEYWFSDHFSVNGRLLLVAPIDLKKGSVQMVTFSPGAGATLYF